MTAADIAEQTATCARCGKDIKRYGSDGIWFTDRYDCTDGALHAPAGYVSARNGKWHRATTPEPTFMHDETTACGRTFRPLNVTWHGERPKAREHFLCKQCGLTS